MTPNALPKFDIAISFLQRDEQLALRFLGALRPLTTFVFSKQQEQLAGTDGMDSFRAAFKEQSRLNVILLRQGWGSTKFTRVEENAIKDRCFDEGFGSLLVVQIEPDTRIQWCSDHKIYFNILTFPFDEAVGAIKRQAAQLGSIVRPLTGLERAQREAVAAEYARESREFLASHRGVRAADADVSGILDATERGLGQIGVTISRWKPFFGRGAMYSGVLHSVARLGQCSVGIDWQRYENTLTDSKFAATFYEGHLSFNKDSPAEKMYGYGGTPRKMTEIAFKAARRPGLDIGWRESAGTLLNAEEVAGQILESLTKYAHQVDTKRV